MAEYFIDSLTGEENASGLSQSEPRPSIAGISLLPGDTVNFRRGSDYRGICLDASGSESAPITYRAYGDGEAPRFYGSKNCSAEYLWEDTGDNIWKLKLRLPTEAGNIVFDFGAECGEMCVERSSLDENGKWTYSDRGCGDSPCPDAEFLLYCEKNPGKYYNDIEICLYGKRRLARGSHVRFEGLHFLCGGVHGYAETSPCDVMISECIFEHIGGCVWDKDRNIRFGNAVELWNGGKNVKIDNCDFFNIYDSCFTTQGNGADCGEFEDISVTSNTFSDYGMAAYEIRDRIGKNVRFEFNVCDGAGAGFSMLTDMTPRNSEIYPLPVGYHIFVWREYLGASGGSVRIKSNIFRGVTAGGATMNKDVAPAVLAAIDTDF